MPTKEALILIISMLAFVLDTAGSVYEESSQDIFASEILENIKKGYPIHYENVTIYGDLDLANIDLPKVVVNKPSFEFGFPHISETAKIVNSDIVIKNSNIRGTVNFNETIFKNSTNFLNSIFKEDVYFIDSQFDGYTNFAFAKFEGEANLEGAKFLAYTDFSHAYFFKCSRFNFSKFNGDLDVEGAKFIGDLHFDESVFSGYADFSGSTFYSDVAFEGCDFRGDVGFENCHLYQDLNLSRAKFDRYIYFNNADINGNIDFINTKLFLFLTKWATIRDHIRYEGASYVQLIKNFRDLEQFEDADECYYQYRYEKLLYEPLGWTKLLDFISFISCGFGVRLSHTFISASIVIMLFGTYFTLNRKSDIKNFRSLKRKFAECIFLSGMTLLSLPGDWYPFDYTKYNIYKNRFLKSMILERLIGWALMILLIGVLTRLMIRY